MTERNRRRRLFGLGLPLAALAVLSTGATGDPWDSWERLRLRARGIPLFSGHVTMQLRHEGGKSRLETCTVAKFFGAKIAQSETLSILDRATGRTERYESISKKRGRRYVFGATGYRVEKLTPPSRKDQPLESWEIQSVKEYAYPTDESGKSVEVSDYYGMLLRLGRLELQQTGDEALLHVATSKGPTAYRILVSRERTGEQTFFDARQESSRTVEVRELRLRIVPADPERADEGFLEMEGETELWVEADSKTLLRLSGKIPRVPGRVRLVLAELG